MHGNGLRRVLLMLPLLIGPAPALGQTPPADSPACQRQCGATMGRRQDNSRAVQSCLGRCQALEAHRVAPKPSPRAGPRPTAPLAQATPPGTARHGAIYLAAAPSARFGITAGMGDRNAAHRVAELQCIGPEGAICRLARDFGDRCGAVAQGVVGLGLRITEDPSTYRVLIATAGSGQTPEAAQGAALADCRMRHRGATCRIAATQCGGGP
jgi:hypothetical protein